MQHAQQSLLKLLAWIMRRESWTGSESKKLKGVPITRQKYHWHLHRQQRSLSSQLRSTTPLLRRNISQKRHHR